MNIMANSEDPDEMLHYAAFHECLQCLQRQMIWSNAVAELVELGIEGLLVDCLSLTGVTVLCP